MDSVQILSTESLKQELDELGKKIDRLSNKKNDVFDILFDRFCEINKELLSR